MSTGYYSIGIATNATPEELYCRWQDLSTLRLKVAEIAQTKSQQWRRAHEDGINTELTSTLWGELDELWREYRVVSAWVELTYSAWVFQTEGTESSFINQVDGPINSVSPR